MSDGFTYANGMGFQLKFGKKRAMVSAVFLPNTAGAYPLSPARVLHPLRPASQSEAALRAEFFAATGGSLD